MAERRGTPEVTDDDNVREQLNVMSTLMFVTPHSHPAARKARDLDDRLRPVREHAKAALAVEPRDGPPTEAARTALARCWQLIDEAGTTIDAAGWWLHRGNSTRAWAEGRVEAGVNAVARREAWRRWARSA